MKALTLIQPWSWAIAHAGKRVENRTWAPPKSVIGQRIAIHAGKKLDLSAARGSLLSPLLWTRRGDRVEAFVHGAVESVATVAGWVRECSADMPDDPTACLVAPGHNIADVLDAPESPWFIGPIGWVLTDVIALPEPVPCRGAQGLWTLPDDVERRVMAQVGGVV